MKLLRTEKKDSAFSYPQPLTASNIKAPEISKSLQSPHPPARAMSDHWVFDHVAPWSNVPFLCLMPNLQENVQHFLQEVVPQSWSCISIFCEIMSPTNREDP